MNATISNNASREASFLASKFVNLQQGDAEAVWIGDGSHKGTTVLRSRSYAGTFHAYNHEGHTFHENIDGLTLIEGNGADGDETGMNQHPGLIGVDFDCQNGLWLIDTSEEGIGELPEGHSVVWTSNPK